MIERYGQVVGRLSADLHMKNRSISVRLCMLGILGRLFARNNNMRARLRALPDNLPNVPKPAQSHPRALKNKEFFMAHFEIHTNGLRGAE